MDDTLTECHRIKQAQTHLLPGLIFPPELYLSSIGLLSPEVCAIRDRLKLAYETSIIPLTAYAHEYNKYLDLYILDVSEYINNMKRNEIATAQVQEQITFQLASMQEIKNNVPNEITIGSFDVNTTPLKQSFIEKRKLIADSLLQMLTESLKSRMNNIVSNYEEIRKRLLEDPPSIEGICETREFMDTIPIQVAELSENFQRLRMEYDVLDAFKWNIPDEDFKLKWHCVGYPLQIEQQVFFFKYFK